MADNRHFEKSKNVALMGIINSLLKTGNKTVNIYVKTAVFTHLLTATDRKPPKNYKKAMLTTLTLTFSLC